ncbi:MAG: acyltransferase [Gammaproteobacteria bacterium]|nr:acyltransferase [Gammaproteobacteria bacterium]
MNQPPAIAKYIVIAAPHTSNWDFLIFMASAGYLRTNISFLAKHSLFEGYFGRLFYWLGGIPVKRESVAASAVVDQVVKVFSEREHLILGIAPEGTRSRVAKWKTGFYRIAMTAGVPIVPGYVDSATKTIGFGETFTPSGDIEADLVLLQDFYKGKTGVNPQNH